MKVGDNVPVTLAGHVVAQARVSELGDGKAVLVVPATQVTMAVRTELDPTPVAARERETIIDGVERAENNTAATDETQTEATQPVETTGTAETVTPDAETATAEQVVENGAVETTETSSVETVEPSDQA